MNNKDILKRLKDEQTLKPSIIPGRMSDEYVDARTPEEKTSLSVAIQAIKENDKLKKEIEDYRSFIWQLKQTIYDNREDIVTVILSYLINKEKSR